MTEPASNIKTEQKEQMEHKEFEARIDQMLADARYNSIRAFWHPVLIAAALLGTGAALARLLLI
ncbi:MAG: hypothetical protein GDA39_10095 [Hyphomonadaceae bacterium]|nr:hypothetical protein [Hyphomonadaceae bacterium]MBC6413183.1 hypothetical protein [Hyphomonadaceae bacterium]